MQPIVMPKSASNQDVDQNALPLMMKMITGFWTTQCIYVAAKLGIADKLAENPLTLYELAEDCQCHPDFLNRVLQALVSLGVFQHQGGQIFQNTDLSRLLMDRPDSMRAAAIMMGDEHFKAWGNLLDGVKTGESPFEKTFGKPVFEYYQDNVEASRIFNQAMTFFSTTIQSAAVEVYDFSPFQKVVDVGGGQGRLLKAILSQAPDLLGVLFDLPHVLEGASDCREAFPDRVQVAVGDFFESIVPGGDVYVLSNIIHDWNDEAALKILQNVHAAMEPNGTLILVEHVIEPEKLAGLGPLMDVNMLAMTQGGRERTRGEFARLFLEAGFTLTQVLPTNSGVCVIEGKRCD